MFRKIILSLLVMLVGFSSMAVAQDVFKIKVVVNGEIITQMDYDDRLNRFLTQVKKQTQGRELMPEEIEQVREITENLLGTMVDEKLIEQEVRKYGFEVSDEEIDDSLNAYKEEAGITQEQFNEAVESQGLNIEEVREQMRQDILKRRLLGNKVRDKVVITDDEVEEIFVERMGGVSSGRILNLSLIVLSADRSASEVWEIIDSGDMTFAEAADEFSIGPGVGEGGNIGDVAWQEMSEEWRTVLANVEAGEISQPFMIETSEAILMFNSESEGEVGDYSDVKEEIFKELREKKFDNVFEEYMADLREAAVLEYK